MSELKSSSAASEAPRELFLTRILGAPRELVFKAWTDPKQVVQWWGPRGFTNPVCEWDVRPGGAIRIHMRGPDGTVYPMGGEFKEVVSPERLVFISTALADEKDKPLFEILNTITFEDFHGVTKLRLHARLLTPEFKITPQVAAALSGMEQGWSESLYRLADQLEKMRGSSTPSSSHPSTASSTADREIVISRVFDAPRDVVWEAWTDPKQVVQWWGPRGFTTTIHEMDVRPGGVWRHTMHGPDGLNYPSTSLFAEVVKHERIVLSLVGGREGGPGVSFHSTWTFEKLAEKTKVTIRMVFETVEARDFNVREFRSIEGGEQTLERLANYVDAARR